VRVIIPFVLLGILALGGRALANDIYLPKQTAEALKAVCDKVNGKFSQDSNGYGCGTDCHGQTGTACVVFCKPGERCIAQVITGRRPRSTEEALAPKHRSR
jgi:hypothetical protein